jgi:hypothetical protein
MPLSQRPSRIFLSLIPLVFVTLGCGVCVIYGLVATPWRIGIERLRNNPLMSKSFTEMPSLTRVVRSAELAEGAESPQSRSVGAFLPSGTAPFYRLVVSGFALCCATQRSQPTLRRDLSWGPIDVD